MTSGDIIPMTHKELDRLWFQAMEDSIRDGEMVARYHFAKLIYEATFRDANIAASRTIIDAAVLHEREACAKVALSIDDQGSVNQRSMQKRIVRAIRARGTT